MTWPHFYNFYSFFTNHLLKRFFSPTFYSIKLFFVVTFVPYNHFQPSLKFVSGVKNELLRIKHPLAIFGPFSQILTSAKSFRQNEHSSFFRRSINFDKKKSSTGSASWRTGVFVKLFYCPKSQKSLFHRKTQGRSYKPFVPINYTSL